MLSHSIVAVGKRGMLNGMRLQCSQATAIPQIRNKNLRHTKLLPTKQVEERNNINGFGDAEVESSVLLVNIRVCHDSKQWTGANSIVSKRESPIQPIRV